MSTSYFNHTFEADVTFKNVANGELLTTNSQGKVTGTTQAIAFGTINAKSYGAIGNLVYTINSDNLTVTYISGTNSTTPIQNALTAAGNLALNNQTTNFNGKVLCYIPAGNYYITQTLTIPANVILQCDGTLFNFKSNNEPFVVGADYSECRRLTIFANNKNGVEWGVSAANKAYCNINQLKVYAVNTTFNAQTVYRALKLSGINFNLDQLYLEGGYIGLDIYASRLFISQIVIKKSFTGVALNSCEHLIAESIYWDSVIDVACKIDNSSDCLIRGRATVNSNAGATPMSKGVVIGSNSTINNTNLDIEYIAQSTGGILLSVASAKDCKIKTRATNSRTTDQSNISNSSHWIADVSGAVHNHNIGTIYLYNNGSPTETSTGLIDYGSNLSGFLDIDLHLDETIAFLFNGTQVGTLNIVVSSGLLSYVNNISKSLVKTLTIQFNVSGSSNDVYISPDYTFYNFTACGGGGGAGSGRLSPATGTAAWGGGGGSGGAIAELSGIVSELLTSGSTTLYKFIVGAKGTGGASVAISGNDGNPGIAGGTTQIKRASDNYIALSAIGGSLGQGGTTTSGSAGTATAITNATQTTTAGTASSATGTPSTPTTLPFSPGSGAGGGGISTANVPFNGGNRGIGGSIAGSNLNANTGGLASTTGNAGNGADGQTKLIYGNTGGHGGAGGGASSAANSNGGKGGNGGNGDHGGGGGGGGAARNGSSGAGGDGGAGWIIAVFWG